jgi:hypothetical protein
MVLKNIFIKFTLNLKKNIISYLIIWANAFLQKRFSYF